MCPNEAAVALLNDFEPISRLNIAVTVLNVVINAGDMRGYLQTL